jgi:hypothetical protein
VISGLEGKEVKRSRGQEVRRSGGQEVRREREELKECGSEGRNGVILGRV